MYSAIFDFYVSVILSAKSQEAGTCPSTALIFNVNSMVQEESLSDRIRAQNAEIESRSLNDSPTTRCPACSAPASESSPAYPLSRV